MRLFYQLLNIQNDEVNRDGYGIHKKDVEKRINHRALREIPPALEGC